MLIFFIYYRWFKWKRYPAIDIPIRRCHNSKWIQGPGASFTCEASLVVNVILILIGLLFLSAGTYASVESIILGYEADSFGGAFTCASNGLWGDEGHEEWENGNDGLRCGLLEHGCICKDALLLTCFENKIGVSRVACRTSSLRGVNETAIQ